MRPHKKLEVWKQAMELTKLTYQLTKSLPDNEKFGMASQLKRASVSIPANIAEGAARQTKKEFKQFLYIANGSLNEMDTLIELATELNLIKKEHTVSLNTQIDKVGAMNNGLIKSLNQQITS